jgi:hypothetical protein
LILFVRLPMRPKAFQVSEPSVKRAKHVADNGDKTVVEAVKAGAITVNAGNAARLFGVSWSLVDRGTDPLMPKAKERQKRKPDNSVVENLPQQNSVCLWKICHRHAPTTTGQTHKQSRPAAFLGANGATFFKFGERQPTRSGSRKRRNRAGVIDA